LESLQATPDILLRQQRIAARFITVMPQASSSQQARNTNNAHLHLKWVLRAPKFRRSAPTQPIVTLGPLPVAAAAAGQHIEIRWYKAFSQLELSNYCPSMIPVGRSFGTDCAFLSGALSGPIKCRFPVHRQRRR